MAIFLLILSVLLSLSYQINSQFVGPPLSFLNPRPYTDALFETPRNYIDIPRNFLNIPRNFIDVPRFIEAPRNFIQPQPAFIVEPPSLPNPYNYPLPINSIPAIPPPTTVITDCTPSVCQNLADTINLMIVSNLLQNSLGDIRSLKMAAPYLKNVLSKMDLGRYPGPLNPNLIAPYPNPLVNPNLIAPYSNLLVNPDFIGPNVIPPTFVAPNSISSNVPIDNRAMLSNILRMIGNVV